MSDVAKPQCSCLVFGAGGRIGYEVAYCSRCNQTRPVLARKVTHASARIVERQRLCSICMWVVDLVVEGL